MREGGHGRRYMVLMKSLATTMEGMATGRDRENVVFDMREQRGARQLGGTSHWDQR